jgi:hypothetical protein
VPLLLLLAACASGLPARMSDCADFDCRSRWAAARWDTDRQGVTDGIAALSAPMERVALVHQLTAAHPGDADGLCALLDGPDEQAACHTRNRRPHLKKLTVTQPDVALSNADDSAQSLIVSVPIASPWADTKPETVPCAIEPRVCQTEAAQQRAGAGDTAGAAAACAAIDDPKWKAECFFDAAEAEMMLPGDPGAAAPSLCLGASAFAGRCLTHVLPHLGSLAPAATSGDTAAWTRLAGFIDADHTLLAADPALADAFVDRAWGFALKTSFLKETDVTGIPAGLPAAAEPHVRAAAAWRLLTLEAEEDRNLAAWDARLAEVMGNTATRPHTGELKEGVAPQPRGFWSEVLPGEERIPRVSFLGENGRARVRSPIADGTICLLESAAIVDPTRYGLLEEGLGSPVALVRWTAARLLRALDVDDGALRHHEDDDPLVQGRLPPKIGKRGTHLR